MLGSRATADIRSEVEVVMAWTLKKELSVGDIAILLGIVGAAFIFIASNFSKLDSVSDKLDGVSTLVKNNGLDIRDIRKEVSDTEKKVATIEGQITFIVESITANDTSDIIGAGPEQPLSSPGTAPSPTE